MTEQNLVFCPECRGDVEYTVEEKVESLELKGEVYTVPRELAFCKNCGAELYIDHLSDQNLKVLYNAHRERLGIISIEDIRRIIVKYNIGKVALSHLLGWGTNTFSRFWDGKLPSKQYSEELKRILSEPEYYLSLLERNKDALDNKAAFEKSLAATNKLIADSDTQNLAEIFSEKKKVCTRQKGVGMSVKVFHGIISGLEVFQVPLMGLNSEKKDKEARPHITRFRRCVHV